MRCNMSRKLTSLICFSLVNSNFIIFQNNINCQKTHSCTVLHNIHSSCSKVHTFQGYTGNLGHTYSHHRTSLQNWQANHETTLCVLPIILPFINATVNFFELLNYWYIEVRIKLTLALVLTAATFLATISTFLRGTLTAGSTSAVGARGHWNKSVSILTSILF